MKNACVLLLCFLTTSLFSQHVPIFDIQGHRGARGLRPENTIPAFITALEAGVTTIEMDVVVTRDKRIVVSHEPWMAADICLDTLGNPIAEEKEQLFNIYQMTYEQVRQFDCGSKRHEEFPYQQLIKASKPLLSNVIIAVENHIKDAMQYEVDYSIEIKATVEGDGLFHPSPSEFSDLVYSLINQYLPLGRVVIQSFSFDVLQYWHAKYPNIRLVALTGTHQSPEKYLDQLGFIPTVYSPHHSLLKQADVEYLHSKNIKVIPWTVNHIFDMIALRKMGVDGLITDYPDRATTLWEGMY